jgi:hypothetical protein
VDQAAHDALPEAVARESSAPDSALGAFPTTQPVWGDSLSTSVCTVRRLANPTELVAFRFHRGKCLGQVVAAARQHE